MVIKDESPWTCSSDGWEGLEFERKLWPLSLSDGQALCLLGKSPGEMGGRHPLLVSRCRLV